MIALQRAFTIALLILAHRAHGMDGEDLPSFSISLKEETFLQEATAKLGKPVIIRCFEDKLRAIMRIATPDSAQRSEEAAMVKKSTKTDNSNPHIHWYAASTIGERSQQQDSGVFFNPTVTDIPFSGACLADGHGATGHFIAHKVVQMLPRVAFTALNAIETSLTQIDSKAVFAQAFEAVENNLITKSYHTRVSPHLAIDLIRNGGAAAVLALFSRDIKKVYVSHVGDCRALYYNFDTDTATWLTQDHKPELDTEAERITKAGGLIAQAPDEPFLRVCEGMASSSCCSYTGLNMSRSFGDARLKKFGLSAEPDVCVQGLLPTKQMIVLCSDGICEAPTGVTIEASAQTIAHLAKRGLELKENPADYLVTMRPYFTHDNATAIVAVVNP